MTTAEARSINAALSVFPRARTLGVWATIAEVWKGLTGVDHDASLYAARIQRGVMHTHEELSDAWCTTLALPASEHPALLTIDASLIHLWLQAMLEEPDRLTTRPRRLHARDHGMATYLLLRVRDALVRKHGAPPFLLPALAPRAQTIDAIFQSSEDTLSVSWLVTAKHGAAGFVRLWLPTPMACALRTWGAHASPTMWSGAVQRARVRVPVYLGSATLRRAECVGLEQGDIVLLEHHGLMQSGREDGAGWLGNTPKRSPVLMHIEDGAWTITWSEEGDVSDEVKQTGQQAEQASTALTRAAS
ncbi:MAG: hypothetical protein AAGI01_17155, partial [Myxococcota bacterium]